MALENLIEAILFTEGQALRISRLAELMEVDQNTVLKALEKLEENLANRGLALARQADEVALVTARETSDGLEKLAARELAGEVSRASLETLAVIVYLGPIHRAKIDYIRGVNSTFTLRSLMIRDLVERVADPVDARTFLYQPTMNLLLKIGLQNWNELPDYQTVRQDVAAHYENESLNPNEK